MRLNTREHLILEQRILSEAPRRGPGPRHEGELYTAKVRGGRDLAVCRSRRTALALFERLVFGGAS